VWRSAGHVAGSAATIALIAPTPGDARSRELIPYDLGQATLSIMVAAADLGMAALMQRSATRSWRGGVQEQGVPDHPRLVVAALVAGSLLGGGPRRRARRARGGRS
jgi:hypothetical protein